MTFRILTDRDLYSRSAIRGLSRELHIKMGDGPLSQAHLIQSLIDIANTIGLKGDYIKSHKKECASLTRRVKLLAPLFEELRESRQRISYQAFTALQGLEEALQSVNSLLQMCHDGSKLYLVSVTCSFRWFSK